MKKQASDADRAPVERPCRNKMTRKEYVQALRRHYLEGTLDDVLMADMDVPDTLVEAVFPELYDSSSRFI